MKKKRTQFGAMLRQTRFGLEMTMRDVERKSGVSIAQLSKLESEDCNPTLSTMKALTTLYRLTPEVWFQ
jgi:transcriptional regulator with XRE-family HTH domain